MTRAYYGAIALVLLATFSGQVALNIREDHSLVNMFSYFTIQSNLLVLVTSCVLAARPQVSGRAWRVVRLAALAGITVTGIVYATVLAPYVHLSGQALAYNYVFHYVVPIATVVGFVLVGPRLPLGREDLVFMVWPVLYLVYTMVRAVIAKPEFTGLGETPSRYPYRFLDVDQVPLAVVVLSIVVIALLLVGVGAAYIWGEHRLDARVRRRHAVA